MADKKPFEKIFPYFSYRWRYDDGQYSPYAPFTQAQFVSDDPDVSEYFKKGHNTSIANVLKVMNLTNIPRGGPDVVAIDVLYKESISNTVYILKTIEIEEKNRGQGFESIQISKRSFGSALPNDQLSRHFDNVPLKANSQEITANRLMYGNYVHKYDILNPLEIEIGINSITQPHNGPSVKTNRTYEVGVAYLDKYGRVGNLLTQKISKGAEGSSFTTDFAYKNRVALTAKIKSPAPAWAKYFRFYVKDPSNEHFNLSAFHVYNDGTRFDEESDNVYLQFVSSDRNKLTDDTILIPRRYNISGSEVLFTDESRHPILDIENEAPDVVKNQVNERKLYTLTSFIDQGFELRGSHTAGTAFTAQNYPGGTTLALGAENDEIDRNNVKVLNDYIREQDPDETVVFEQALGATNPATQTVDISEYADRLAIRIVPQNKDTNATLETSYALVDSISYQRADRNKRSVFVFNLGDRLDDDYDITTSTGLEASATNMQTSGKEANVQLAKLGLSEEGQDKLKGSFFVKVPRKVVNNSNILEIPTFQTPYNEDGNVATDLIKEINFETEPIDESNLDLYWESGETFPIRVHQEKQQLEWANCIASKTSSTGNIYLESTKIFDKFNSVAMQKGTRVTTPEARYAREHRKSGLIFSGLYNSKTGINELNQFNMALNPTKELEPNYGGIQKLFTLDTNLLAFAEDKVFRILADKDALFNADEGVNVTATNLVLGQAMVYQGQYGISAHPESFAFWGNNAYFTDAKRGVVMQLTPANGQLFPISSRGMSNFFRDRIGTASKLIGAYDGTKKQYVLSMQGYDQNAASIGSETIPNETSNITLGYSLRSEGWTSRFSFIPESGITMANRFYTFKNGKAYLHNSDTADRNNFYGTAYNSEVQIIFNDNPTYISDFLTLNYEGDSNWEASEIIGDQDGVYSITNVRILDSDEAGFLGWFLKEGKYHGSIVGTQPVYIIDPAGTVGADGFWPLIQDGANTQDISGTKGFFAKVRFKNDATTAKELFAISSEYYISQT